MKKQTTPPAELIQAAKAVFEARAQVQILTPIINGLKTDLLLEMNAVDENGEAITTAKDAWQICDDQAPVYYEALAAVIAAAGFEVEAGYCPLLLAESAEREAIRNMLKTAEIWWKSAGVPLSYERIRNSPTVYNQVVDTTLTFLAQFVK